MRFGVIGTNFISKEFAAAGKSLDDFSIPVIYSRRMETAQAFADQIGGADCVTDLDLLAQRPDIDAVYIASPNLFHYPQAEKMLRAGKHVLLEKPACINAEQFSRLCILAREKGVVLMEAMRPAFIPGFLAIADGLEQIGTVRRVSFTYCQYSSRYDKYKRGIIENAFDPTLGNGALMDIGVYCIHGLLALFGLPDQVHAVAQKLPNGLDAQGGAQCIYDGMLAELSWSKIADHRRENEIQGELGTLLIDSITKPKKIRLIKRDRTEQTLYYDPSEEFFGMCHEIQAFMDFCSRSPGEAPWRRYQQRTQDTLTLMDEIRCQTGIDFQNQFEGKDRTQ